jgi:hypothetical protein
LDELACDIPVSSAKPNISMVHRSLWHSTLVSTPPLTARAVLTSRGQLGIYLVASVALDTLRSADDRSFDGIDILDDVYQLMFITLTITYIQALTQDRNP